MKRAAGRSDRDFINDLKNDRIVDRELSSETYREYIQQVVQARMEFNRKLEEAGIPNPTGDIAKVPKVPESEMIPAESEVNQWLTESETSENLLLSTSDTNEAASGLYPETVHSA